MLTYSVDQLAYFLFLGWHANYQKPFPEQHLDSGEEPETIVLEQQSVLEAPCVIGRYQGCWEQFPFLAESDIPNVRAASKYHYKLTENCTNASASCSGFFDNSIENDDQVEAFTNQQIPFVIAFTVQSFADGLGLCVDLFSKAVEAVRNGSPQIEDEKVLASPGQVKQLIQVVSGSCTMCMSIIR